MRLKLIAVAFASSLLTFIATRALADGPKSLLKLENGRVRVTEMTYEPGVPRERYIRPTDQIIVFLDNCRYERTDSATHAKQIQERKSGDVIWHNKGEDAPVLVNLGKRAYRTMVIELK